ncbi:MAG: hypothetical protein ABI760_10850 [Ferruginibacter sp.]
MKKIFIIVVLIAMTFVIHRFAQYRIKTLPSQKLTSNCNIRYALIAGDIAAAASGSGKLIKGQNVLDKEIENEQILINLLSDGGIISQNGYLAIQREKLATLSANIFALAKTAKGSPESGYRQFCPLKKPSSLNNSKAIKNSYCGNAMPSPFIPKTLRRAF